jgi:hypothetical protein
MYGNYLLLATTNEHPHCRSYNTSYFKKKLIVTKQVKTKLQQFISDGSFLSTKDLFKTNCLVGIKVVFVIQIPKSQNLKRQLISIF